MEVREDDEEYKNPVDRMFEELEAREPNHFAVRQYKKYSLAAGKTAKSILVSCGARLAPFDIAELREITMYDELELDTLGDKIFVNPNNKKDTRFYKTALFLIMSDTDSTFIGEAVYEVSRLFSGEQTVSSLLESQIERMIMENTSFDEENHSEV